MVLCAFRPGFGGALQTVQMCVVIGRFFSDESICRDKDLIPFMGNTELIQSNHVGVIDASCIEGVC